jgi:hypothetical protein
MVSRMERSKKAAAAVLGFRVAYGVALLVVPGKVAGKRWLGPGAYQAAATVGLRGLGAREIAVHGIALVELARGGAVRPYLAASIIGDLADIASTFASRDGLPDNSAIATAAVAGGSAALTAAVAASLEK